MIHIREEQIRELLPPQEGMDTAVTLLETGFANLAVGLAQNQPRRRVRAGQGAHGGAMLHVMSAADAGSGFLGAKIYSTSPQGAHFFFLLFELATGEPLALMDADYLGQMRTGAASALATRLLARAEASVLAVIGAGLQARTQVLGISRVRRLREVRASSRSFPRCQAFAAQLEQETGIPVRAFPSAREAVLGADIVVTATNSKDPVLFGEWLEEGMHVNAIGSNSAARRELDEAAVRRAEVIVADSVEQSRIESGELLAVPECWTRVQEFADLVAGRIPGRRRREEVTLFKSNGLALEDVVLGGWIWEKLKNRGSQEASP